MNAIIIVHTSIYIYGGIHIGFVIINFWQIECAVLICIFVIVLYVLQLIHILNNVILFTFLREKNVNFVSLFLTRDLLLFFIYKKKIVESGTSIVLYKIICTFLSRTKLETPSQRPFAFRIMLKSCQGFIQMQKPVLLELLLLCLGLEHKLLDINLIYIWQIHIRLLLLF